MHSAPDDRHLPNGGLSRRARLSGCAVLFLSLSNPLLSQDECDSLLNVDFVVTVDGYVAAFTDLTSNDLSDVHYWWDYGDGIVEHLGGYQHTYADTGSYSACLSVSGSYNGDTCASAAYRDVRIDLPAAPSALLVWPQPFTDGFTVTGKEVIGADQAELLDPSGRLITAVPLAPNELLKFSFPGLVAGGYVLQVIGPFGRRVIRVVKE